MPATQVATSNRRLEGRPQVLMKCETGHPAARWRAMFQPRAGVGSSNILHPAYVFWLLTWPFRVDGAGTDAQLSTKIRGNGWVPGWR